MNYNPFAEKYTALEKEIIITKERLREQNDSLKWYTSFDLEKAASTHQATMEALHTIKQRLPKSKTTGDHLASRALELQRVARLGWDPRYWFSIERQQHSIALKEMQLKIATHKRDLDADNHRAQTHETDIIRQEKLLRKYQEYDSTTTKSKINSLASYLDKITTELLYIERKKIQIDQQLCAPLQELEKIRQEISQLQIEIENASEISRKITAAANGYERKILHEECTQIFGDGKPFRIIENKRRKIEFLERNTAKLERRLESIGQRTSRKIDKIVIDGSNLCYKQGENFIGPNALRAAAENLIKNHRVVIVFDSSINYKLKMRNDEIHALFSEEIETCVVASKFQADEILLNIADGTTTYVISNDRYTDYTDKLAVRDNRIIRHEILDGRILIPDLNLNEYFD